MMARRRQLPVGVAMMVFGYEGATTTAPRSGGMGRQFLDPEAQ
jgi:hypothetical protein